MLKMNFIFPFGFFFCISGLLTMYICYLRKNAVYITFKREKKRKLGLISCPLSVISEDKQGGITLPGHMFLIIRCGNSLPNVTGGLWTSLVKKLTLQEAFGHHWLRNYVGLIGRWRYDCFIV